MLDRSRRRFEEGSRLVEEAHRSLGEIQQLLIGSPVSLSAEENEEAASRLLASLKASGSELPESLCGGRLAVDPVQRLARFANGADVDTTIVGGRVLMRGRKLLHADEGAILDRAERAFHLAMRRAGRA